MRKWLSTIILIIIFLIGLSLLLYPTVSDYWNSFHQSRAILNYMEQVSKLDEDEYEQLWAAAAEYNQVLFRSGIHYEMTEEQLEEYESLLNISGDGVMGYVEIPVIDCRLPVYHGTGADVLQVAAGHLEWTSLPVGGENTHCVISGHRGLPSARLFTDLDQLQEGDIFYLHVLNETLAYEVDQIMTILPDELEELKITPGADYCTLFTCTPYGINSHRLLVRGHRVEFSATGKTEETRVVPVGETGFDIRIVPLVFAAFLLILLLIFLLFGRRRKKK